MMTNWRPIENPYVKNQHFINGSPDYIENVKHDTWEKCADAILDALMRGECLSGELVAEMAINRYGFSTPKKNRKGTWVFIPDKEGE